ncbi:MAG: glucuronate isomerase [Terriglobia bacterium]
MMKAQNRNVVELAAQLLESVVRPSPVVDVHTHIRPAEPAARYLGEIVFYHYILTELETAGVSRAKLENAKTAEEKMALFASSQRLVSNTVTYWCLRQVLRTLDIEAEADLTLDALTDAARRVQKTSSNGSWPRKVLAEQNNIQKTFLTLNATEALPDFDASLFAGTLRLDDLLTDVSSSALDRLGAVSGATIGSLDSFERAIGERLNAFAKSGGRALTAGMPTDEDFACSGKPVAEKLFAKVRRDEPLELPERAALHSYTLHFCVGQARDLRLPVQLLLGVRRPLPGNAAVPVLRQDLAVRFASLFNNFPNVSFDLLLSSVVHSQELIAVAKNYPNVCLAGHWWYAFSPPYIRSMLTERLLALPVVKLHGFFSDAYNVEWSAGKLALLRRELAWVLAELMVSGYLTESQAPEIARALLYENPARFYSLADKA